MSGKLPWGLSDIQKRIKIRTAASSSSEDAAVHSQIKIVNSTLVFLSNILILKRFCIFLLPVSLEILAKSFFFFFLSVKYEASIISLVSSTKRHFSSVLSFCCLGSTSSQKTLLIL